MATIQVDSVDTESESVIWKLENLPQNRQNLKVRLQQYELDAKGMRGTGIYCSQPTYISLCPNRATCRRFKMHRGTIS